MVSRPSCYDPVINPHTDPLSRSLNTSHPLLHDRRLVIPPPTKLFWCAPAYFRSLTTTLGLRRRPPSSTAVHLPPVHTLLNPAASCLLLRSPLRDTKASLWKSALCSCGHTPKTLKNVRVQQSTGSTIKLTTRQVSRANSQQIEYACGHWHGQAAVWCPTYTRTHRRCAPHFTHYQFRYVVDFEIMPSACH